jgi:phosphoglycolate phosphatase
VRTALHPVFLSVSAALFDLDGTLVDTHIDFPHMKRAVLALAGEYGVDTDGWDGWDPLRIVETARLRLTELGQPGRGESLRRTAFAQLERIEVEQCASPDEVPGASDLLAVLHESGIHVGIVTRNCRVVSERLVLTCRLPCDALLTRDDVPLTKPDPAHLRAALAAIGMREGLAPEVAPAAVMVGDHWMDAQGGKAAGLRTVGLLRGRPESFFAPAMPDVLVSELGDLLKLDPCEPRHAEAARGLNEPGRAAAHV